MRLAAPGSHEKALIARLSGGNAQYHPEAGSALAWGVMARKDSGRDLLNPLGEENRCAAQQAPNLGPWCAYFRGGFTFLETLKRKP